MLSIHWVKQDAQWSKVKGYVAETNVQTAYEKIPYFLFSNSYFPHRGPIPEKVIIIRFYIETINLDMLCNDI